MPMAGIQNRLEIEYCYPSHGAQQMEYNTTINIQTSSTALEHSQGSTQRGYRGAQAIWNCFGVVDLHVTYTFAVRSQESNIASNIHFKTMTLLSLRYMSSYASKHMQI